MYTHTSRRSVHTLLPLTLILTIKSEYSPNSSSYLSFIFQNFEFDEIKSKIAGFHQLDKFDSFTPIHYYYTYIVMTILLYDRVLYYQFRQSHHYTWEKRLAIEVCYMLYAVCASHVLPSLVMMSIPSTPL